MEIEKLLLEGRTVQVSPIGYSMYPLIVPGRDTVQIKRVDVSRLRRGDVALYRREGSILVLHRIWKRRGDSFFFVGDNQRDIEGPLPSQQICGKMIAVERKGIYIPVENIRYRAFSAVWLWMRPFRPLISHAIHKLKKLAGNGSGQ